MWERCPNLNKELEAARRGWKRVKLYADEDIEDEIVEYLRERKVNITGARELGHRGKPDSFQAAYALKQKRTILTKNGKDFLNDKKLPFNQMYGVIVVEGNLGKEDPYFDALEHIIFQIIPFGPQVSQMKIEVGANRINLRRTSKTGCIVKENYQLLEDGWHQWVEGQEIESPHF